MSGDELSTDLAIYLGTCNRVPEPSHVVGGAFDFAFGSFNDPAWKLYKRAWGIKWDREGRFDGAPALIAAGGRNYTYKPGSPPFSFVRYNGEVVTPGAMVTDDGSIPRVAWSIPGLDPWTYTPAFIVHDWEFMAHHCHPDYSKSFEEVNDTLAEGVYTLMKSGVVREDWRVLATIHAGVASFLGRRVWDRAWSPDECSVCLNPA